MFKFQQDRVPSSAEPRNEFDFLLNAYVVCGAEKSLKKEWEDDIGNKMYLETIRIPIPVMNMDYPHVFRTESISS